MALEALKEQKTLNELSSEFGVHSVQISSWKRILQDHLSSAFAPSTRGDRKRSDREATLLQTIGSLQVENAFLQKKLQKFL